MKLKRWCGALVVCLVVGVVVVGGVMATMTGFSDANAEEEGQNELPSLRISLNGTTLEEINSGSKAIKYTGNQLVLSDNGEDVYFEDIEIKGRGNSTWNDVKKSYRIKFGGRVDVLGMGKARKWAILSYNTDSSLLRGDLGFYLARLINTEYPLSGRFVNVEIDGQNLGVYYMTELVEVGKDRVDLRDPFGVIMELDNAFFGEEEWYYEAESLDHLTIKDVVAVDNVGIASVDFVKRFEELEDAVEQGDVDKIYQIADIESFAEYYLFSEFIGNFDAYITSFYFYKDGINDVIHAGPAWDFDGAFGNTGWVRDEITIDEYAPEVLDTRQKQAFGYNIERDSGVAYVGPNVDVSKLMYNLYRIPEFQDLVGRIYVERLSKMRGEIDDYINSMAGQIRKAAILNNEIWGKGDFDEAVDYLIDWVDRRFDVFDRMYLPSVTDLVISA